MNQVTFIYFETNIMCKWDIYFYLLIFFLFMFFFIFPASTVYPRNYEPFFLSTLYKYPTV